MSRSTQSRSNVNPVGISLAPLLLGWLGLAAAACPALGQCTGQWSNAFPGLTAGPVKAMTTWDPDGAGPLPPVLVIGGDANLAGAPGFHNVLYWNTTTSTWQPPRSSTSIAATPTSG